MKNYAKFTAIILMTALLMAGCSNQTAQDGGNIQAGGNSAVNENVGNIGGDSDGTLSQEEQAAMEAELAAKEEAERAAREAEEAAKNGEKDAAQTTTAEVTAAPTTTAQLSNDATVNGTLIYQNKRYCYMIADYNSAEGWVILFDADGKGYGTPYNAVNIFTGMEIQGEEGAEVYFYPDGILHLEWRYQSSGSRASAETVLLYYPQSGKAPQTFDLYLVKYDYAGNKLSEEFVMSFTQTEEYVYSQVYDVVNPILDSYGVSNAGYDYEMYYFNDESGDAVAYDGEGNEIARYPGKGSDAMMMFISVKDDIMVISGMGYSCFTEIYQIK